VPRKEAQDQLKQDATPKAIPACPAATQEQIRRRYAIALDEQVAAEWNDRG
jgi:hypothetical protein